jgi:hypothetical protein
MHHEYRTSNHSTLWHDATSITQRMPGRRFHISETYSCKAESFACSIEDWREPPFDAELDEGGVLLTMRYGG